MTRDTHKAQGGRTTGRGGDSDASRRPSRLAARVRVVCLLLCVALALQPSLLAPGHAASARVRGAGGAQSSLADFTVRSLLAAVMSIASVLRPASPTPVVVAVPPATLDAAYEPEPASAVFSLSAPANLSVDSTSDSTVQLSWSPVPGAVRYRVERRPDLLSPYTPVGDVTSNGFPDEGLTRGSTYLYRVRAVDAAGALSPASAVVMATAVTFLDETLYAAGDPQHAPTKVKWQHVDDLRKAITGVRRAAGLPDPSWSEPVTSGTPVRAVHVQEMRDRLDEALRKLGLPTPAFYDATLHTGENGSTPTPIRKKHFEELRERARSGSGVTGSGLAAYDFASARFDASNRTGGEGVDLISRNFNWSLPLVSLPGRAGLDLGLSLAYNSLVWTRSGNSVLFDGDWGWPAPGFRLGFPVVQGKFYDSQAQKDAYLLMTPSGARVSLRQIGTTAVYEAGDSSYLQLTEESDGTLMLRATSGTRMSYRPLGGVYKCTEIKDKDGNFITAAYNAFDNVQTVTDTLGREINFGYYADGYLKEITQTWHREVESGSTTQTVTETHQWARFYYTDKSVSTNFPGLTVFGPANGQSIHALTKVKLADDSAFTFNYTTWGQVSQIAGYAADNRLLNYVSLDLPIDAATAQTDCPRPTQRRDWAAYWNGDANGVGAASEEAVTTYGRYDFASGVARAEAPDGTVHQETYETSGWRKGLTTRADEFSADDLMHPKKWTVLQWTQDDESLGYEQNPRMRETNVYDSAGNRRRTEVVYTSFGLVQDVKEYDSNAATVLRRTHTEYMAASVNTGGAYTLRRIIGLPEKREVFGLEDGQEKRASKITFEYDLPPNGYTQYLVDAEAVAQHDGAYGASFATRGNLCLARRWDAAYPDDASKSVASEWVYDTLGSAVVTSDALGRKTLISYAGPNGAGGLAYPTKVTDPDNFFSTVEYNYDLGSVTRTVDPKDAAVKTFYDSVGRVLKVKSEFNDAYTKYEYGASGLYLKAFTTVDTGLAETSVMSVTDGAGRMRGSLRELPGSVGGYSAQRFTYDIVGQVVRRYNPTEVTLNASDPADVSSWQPAGDDSTTGGGSGWVYSAAEYDWKGRVTREVNADGVTDRLIEYGGCGCAGGAVVTMKGEEVPIPGTSSTGRRTQKVYHDVLGRVVKSEVLDWNGNVDSATTTKYDALDQPLRVRTYHGPAPLNEPSAEGSGYLTSTFSYDGHGRLKTRHSPMQADSNNQPLVISYDYNDDDTVRKVTDARGATTTFDYNNRRLPASVAYDAPSASDISVPPTATFSYDGAGNRTSMTTANGAGGSVTYTYDARSRLTSEARQFPGRSGTYTLSYEYTLSGALKSVTDQTSPASPVSFSYDFDGAGQTTAVNSTGMGATAPLASNVKYRAWGALKHADYGPASAGVNLNLGYDSRGRVTSYALDGVASPLNGTMAMHTEGGSYQYYPDGALKFASDIWSDQQTGGIQDRAYSYDYAGRIQTALAGTEARDFLQGTNSNVFDGPYRHSYNYDAWGNTRGRTGRYWSQDDTSTDAYADITGRHAAPWVYDADGRLVSMGESSPNGLIYSPAVYGYDAAGRRVSTTQVTSYLMGDGVSVVTTSVSQAETYDGDGAGVRHTVTRQTGGGTPTTEETYLLRSSVLGGRTVSEYNSSGARRTSYAWAGGEVLAQRVGIDTASPELRWQHINPVTGDGKESDAAGMLRNSTHLDPDMVDVGETDPSTWASDPGGGDTGGPAVEDGIAKLISVGSEMNCRIDGILTTCRLVDSMEASGAAVQCMSNDCGPRSRRLNGVSFLTTPFMAFANGVSGFFQQSYMEMGTPQEQADDYYHIFTALASGRLQGINGMDNPNGSANFFAEPQDTPHTANACGDMADWADTYAKQALTAHPNAPKEALAQFDRDFSKLYVGHSAGGRLGAIKMGAPKRLGGRQSRDRTVSLYQLGDSGFKYEFLDKDHDPDNHVKSDQTHHFAAYFTMGISGQEFFADLHATEDGYLNDNRGDARLGTAAYMLGDSLRTADGQDLRDKLNGIGDQIRSKICVPTHSIFKGVP